MRNRYCKRWAAYRKPRMTAKVRRIKRLAIQRVLGERDDSLEEEVRRLLTQPTRA